MVKINRGCLHLFTNKLYVKLSFQMSRLDRCRYNVLRDIFEQIMNFFGLPCLASKTSQLTFFLKDVSPDVTAQTQGFIGAG